VLRETARRVRNGDGVTQSPRHGGRILADALAAHGVKLAFGVPGESFLPVLDGLYDHRERMRFVICRQEGGASYMAEAYAKLTGEPGVLFVTRGPGATNGSVGVHTAMQDSSPLVVLVGQVGNDMAEREAFQEIDYRRMYGPLTKWVGQIDRVDRIPEYVSHAFHTAMAGRRGPVLLALPEDMLFAEASVQDAPRYRAVQPAPAVADIEELETLLERAARPLAIVGGGGWTRESLARLQRWAEAASFPLTTSFRCQDYIDNRSPIYAGDVTIGINPKLAQRVREADLIVAIGARLGEITTSGYTLLEVPVPKQTLVHVHAGAEELGRVYAASLPINAGMPHFVEALERIAVDGSRWREWTKAARADYEAWRAPVPMPGKVHVGEIVQWLSAQLPEDAIVANGAGNFATWLHRHFVYKRYRTQLAPTSGSMGYGLPAAVAAKIAEPKRLVVAWTGDGEFLMTGQEFATAVQHAAPIVAIVVNNGMYGTIRMHQEREYPGRVSGTELRNPDFAAYARAFGGHGETVEATAQFPAAFERALASGKPAILELKIDPEAITPTATLSGLRQKALGSR